MTEFGPLLRHWRTTRRLSQLDLALEANVSARHVSFLETGRAAPSRSMVQQLADVLAIPRGERNSIYEAAGFRGLYQRKPLDDQQLAPVRQAMQRLIQNHSPYPAIVKDRLWRVVDMNPSAQMLFGLAGIGMGDSLLDALAAPDQGRDFIENWGEVGYYTMQRLRAEARIAGGIPELDAAAVHLARDPDIAAFQPSVPMPAIVSTIFRSADFRLPLFSTFAQFGGAEDLTLNELVIELMFPANAEAETLLATLAASASEA